MKRLYLLILRSFLGPFFLVFFIVLFVLLIQFLWRYIDELIGKGLDTKTIGELLLHTSASLVPMALPLSILMSSLMTFGNLGEKYELTAIKASGISLQRILKPLIIFVLCISGFAFFFANNVLPYSTLQMRSLLYDIRQQRPELQIKPGEFNNLIDGYSIRVNDKDPKTNVLYNVSIYDHSKGKGNINVTLADSGHMFVTPSDKYLIFNLYNGHTYEELYNPKKPKKVRSYPHRYNTFSEQQIVIELTGFGLKRTDQNLFKSHYSMLDIKQLGVKEDSLGKEISNKHEQMYANLVTHNYFKNRLNQKNPTPPPTQKKKAVISNGNIPSISNKTSRGIPSNKSGTNNNETKKDTLLTPHKLSEKKNNRIIDIDSLYACMTLQEKSRITNSALSKTRTAKNLVTNSQQSLDFKIEQLRRYEIEWHRKFTLSIACILFMFIGAPLGAIIRKGGLGLPLIISVFFFILYYILSLIGEKLVRESVMLDYEGMWMTSALFLVIGAFITYKATTDSAIFNMDTYSNFIKKLFGQRFNVVDKVHIQTDTNKTDNSAVNVDKLYSSLIGLNDSIDNMAESKQNNFLRITEFFSSLYSNQKDSEYVIFERYYNNTFKAIVNHPLFHNKHVRAKTYEFPALNIKGSKDSEFLQYLLIILAYLPPLTLIPITRRYIKIIILRAKLKQIKQLIPELGTLLKIAASTEKENENSTSL